MLSANHLSGADSVALACALYPRVLRSMAKAQLFSRRPLAALLRALGGFPVTSRDPRAALAAAAAHAGAGDVVVVFPEGARRRRDRVHQPRTGAARVALHAGVPLVPAALRGTDGWRRLTRWQVAIGAPVRLDDLAADAAGARDATRRLWDEIAALEASLAD